MNRTVQRIKRAGCSVMFLIATITFTLYAILTIVGAGTVGAGIEMTLRAFSRSQPGWAELADSISSGLQSVSVSAYVMGGVNLLISLGMWLHFFSSRSSKEPASVRGMVLIKVIHVIWLIVFLVGIVAGFLVLLFVAGGMSLLADFNLDLSPVLLLVAGGCLVGSVLFVIFTVLYIRGILKTIRSVRMTLNTGVIMGKVSVLVIVINYVVAAVLLTGAVLSPTIIGLAGGLCGAVSYVTCSVALGSLRSEMLYIAARGSSSLE
jgi:hypothetical protein